MERSSTETLGRCSSLRLRERDQRLPNYAQPTISSHQHTSKGNDTSHSSPLRFKAGTGRTIRPVSSKSYADKRKEEKKRLGFVDLFQTPSSEAKRTKSSSYQTPSLKKKFDDTKSDLHTIMKETETLISQITGGSEEAEFHKSLEIYKSKLNDESKITIQDWNDLIDHHYLMFQRLQGKLQLDYRLIHNVLELNNSVSEKCSYYKKELEKSRNEIKELKFLLKTSDFNYFNGYSDVFKDLSLNENQPIHRKKQFKFNEDFFSNSEITFDDSSFLQKSQSHLALHQLTGEER